MEAPEANWKLKEVNVISLPIRVLIPKISLSCKEDLRCLYYKQQKKKDHAKSARTLFLSQKIQLEVYDVCSFSIWNKRISCSLPWDATSVVRPMSLIWFFFSQTWYQTITSHTKGVFWETRINPDKQWMNNMNFMPKLKNHMTRRSKQRSQRNDKQRCENGKGDQ